MDALNPTLNKTQSIVQPAKSKKSLWQSVKGIFQKQPETAKQDYSNFHTVKLMPQGGVTMHRHVSIATVHQINAQFESVNDFNAFLRETKPTELTLSTFKQILQANKDHLSKKDRHGKTPFYIAVEANNHAAVEYFLSEDMIHYLDIHQEIYSQRVVFKAIENKDIRMIELLFQPNFVVYGNHLTMTNAKGQNCAEFALEQHKKAPPKEKPEAWNMVYFMVPEAGVFPE